MSTNNQFNHILINQPREFDAVLGGQTQYPVNGTVLGGIEGVKSRLNCTDIHQKIKALKDALLYGDKGYSLVIDSLQDESSQIKSAAPVFTSNKARGKN